MTQNQNQIELNACVLFELWQVSPVVPNGTTYNTNEQQIKSAENALKKSLLLEFNNLPIAAEIADQHVQNLRCEFNRSVNDSFATFNNLPKRKRTPEKFDQIRHAELNRALCFWELNLNAALRIANQQ